MYKVGGWHAVWVRGVVGYQESRMKWVASIFGGLLALLGVLWILQGTGLIPVGLMANHIQYAYYGGVMIVVGAGLVWWVTRKPGQKAG